MSQPQNKFENPGITYNKWPFHFESMPVWQIVFLVLVWFGAFPGFKTLFSEELKISDYLFWWWVISIFLFGIFIYQWVFAFLSLPFYVPVLYRRAFFSITKIKLYFRFDKRKSNWSQNKRLLNGVIRFVKESDRAYDIQFSRKFNFIFVRTAAGEKEFGRGRVYSPLKYKWLMLISVYFFGFLILYLLKRPVTYIYLLVATALVMFCKNHCYYLIN